MPRREQPLESGDDVLLRFAGDLRRLREKAGSPTYRQLGTRAHYSAAALSEAASGRRLPSLAVTLAYVAACDGNTTEWKKRWRETAAEIAANNNNGPDDSDNAEAPYAGWAAFRADDADRFFGRENMISDLLARLSGHRFVGVFGPSGSGTSSLLRAGLTPRLARRGDPVAVLTPGSHPVEECAVRLAPVLGVSPTVLGAELAADPGNLHLRIRQAMADRPDDVDLVLVVDQFEEVFTRCGDDERDWLIDALAAAALAGASRTRVVLGVRDDFHAHCARHPRLAAALGDVRIPVEPLTPDEYRRAIMEPAQRSGCRLETALVSRLGAVGHNSPGALPAISAALREAWRRRRGTTLTLAGYEAFGGVPGLLAHAAETAYTALNADQRPVAKQILLRLAALSDDASDTARRVHRRELDDDQDTAAVLDRLARARVVTLDRHGVELAHESLIRHWSRLRDWLAEDRDGLRVHRQLTEATLIWESLDRDPGALYRGAGLARAQTWLADRDPALTTREREFLAASLEFAARERTMTARRSRLLRRLVALVATMLFVALAATAYAIDAQHTADRQRAAAVAQSALHHANAVLRAGEPTLAVQLALAAYRIDPTSTTRGAVIGTFAVAPYGIHLFGHTQTVRSVSVGPGIVATASDDETVRLWRNSDMATAVLGGPGDPLRSVVVSQDGRTMATESPDRTIRLWDVTTPHNPRPVGRLPGHDGTAVSLVFSPDGQTLAIATLDHVIRLWDVTDRQRPRPVGTILDRVDPAFAMAFNPAGDLLVAGSHHDAILYDVTHRGDPHQVARIASETGPVSSVAFSPGGRTVVTAGSDKIARLWDVADRARPQPRGELTGHTDVVRAVAFAPDGRVLATATTNGTITLWDMTGRGGPRTFATVTGGLDDDLTSIAFRPDSHTLAVASGDRVVLLETDVERVARQICAVAHPRISRAEWDQFLPGLPYDPPCR
ncbi:MAG TPA: hypothetical protein VGX25_26745 [Actinophytocola sp.]|uniref:nSTAND1 domain-containing NTPase n=1 Tax=Actinophytocola sp. TaxID=1872138 RepID=UPI002DDD455C|nr:hypothetical protein [Actinophytocola sp.]HEV2783001.1 hypothetical protein [Actinophytocola sp.]